MAFDIREQTDRAFAVTPDDFDLAAFQERPLAVPTLRCLRYVAGIERHTIRHLRDLLVTPSHTDPVVTEFLTAWAYQQFWLGETLDAVLDAHRPLPPYPPPSAPRRAVQELGDRFAPLRHALTANVIGEDFVAIHMSWGAISEWLADAAYDRIGARADHHELTAVLKRIQEQKRRHVEFYEAQARARLGGSARARTLTRLVLSSLWFWHPHGRFTEPRSETRFVLHHLLADPDGAALVRDIDARVDTLPGQRGLGLVSRVLARYGAGPRVVTR